MQDSLFKKAEIIKKEIEQYERKLAQVEHALESRCSWKVEMSYTRGGSFRAKGSFFFGNEEAIKQLLLEEQDQVTRALSLAKEQFESL